MRVDRFSIALLLLFAVLFVPLVPRATDNPQLLAAFSNDEPALTMALEAMTHAPYGNPASFYAGPRQHDPPVPDYWGHIRYAGFHYYGGFYLDLAAAVFAPLKVLGVPTFPAAPIILRLVSLLAAAGSLVLLYSIARPYAGRWGAFAAGVFMLTDGSFHYYASNIHPDSLQLFLGLLAIPVAAHYVRLPSVAGAIAIGIIAGLVQGTKSGGPWMIPIAVVAVSLGLSRQQGWRAFPWRTAVRHGLAMGAASVVVFLATTPYALGSYYRNATQAAWDLHSKGYFAGRVDWLQWLRTAYETFGGPLSFLMAAGLVVGSLQLFRRSAPATLGLAAVLAITQAIWFSLTAGLWVGIGYAMVAYALGAMLAAWLLKSILDRATKRGALQQILILFCAVFALQQLSERWFSPVSASLALSLWRNDVALLGNEWALGQNLSSDTRILFDDIVYFDYKRFPNARMRGGLMNFTDIFRGDPDYLILVSSIYTSPNIRKLMASQANTPPDSSVWSTHVYQALADVSTLGPTKLPGVELVAILAPDPPPSRTDIIRWGGPTFTPWINQQRAWLHHIAIAVENVAGQRRDHHGHTLKIFRRNPKDGPRGRPYAFASSSGAGYSPAWAFDLSGYQWVAQGHGEAARQQFVGYDFGGGAVASANVVEIQWIAPTGTPRRIAIETSTGEEGWAEVGRFDVSYAAGESNFRTDRFDLGRVVSARKWRIVALDVPEDYAFGVAEIRIGTGQ